MSSSQAQQLRKLLPNPSQPIPPPPAVSFKLRTKVSSVSTNVTNGTAQKQVLRVNRACNSCRKQKMRCDGPDSQPCSRCETHGIECIFEKVSKPDLELSVKRLDALESQFTTVQTTLNQILQRLEVNNPRDSRPSQQSPPNSWPTQSPTLESYPSQPTSSQSSSSELPSLHSVLSSHHHQPLYDHASDFPLPNAPHISPLHTYSSSTGQPSHHPPTSRNFVAPLPLSPGHRQARQFHPLSSSHVITPTSRGADLASLSSNSKFAESALTSAANSDDEGDIPSEALLRPIQVLDTLASDRARSSSVHGRGHSQSRDRLGSFSNGPGFQTEQYSDDHPYQHPTEPPISPSDRDDFYAQSPVSSNPHHSYHSPASSQDSSNLTIPSHANLTKRKRDSLTTEGSLIPSSQGYTTDNGPERLTKLRRTNTVHDSDAEFRQHVSSTVVDVDQSEAVLGTSAGSTKGVPDFPKPSGDLRIIETEDVVLRGIINESEARGLYHLYFTGCYRLLACFSPNVDIFDSMRVRSPLCFCAILLVAAKVRDGAATPRSPLQHALERECVRMARMTIYPLGLDGEDDFLGAVTLESIQAMLLLAGWSDSSSGGGWIMAGHAIRCAVQLGVHKALSRLERRSRRTEPGMGLAALPLVDVMDAGTRENRGDWELIRASRTWLALYVFEYQISFGTGRPAMMKADKSIINARNILLTHSLSTDTDSRLVSTCELLILQGNINDALGPLGSPVDSHTFDVLKNAIQSIDNWLSEWDDFMGRNHPSGDFFRASAAIQHSYAHLFTRCVVLRYVKTPKDAQNISVEMKECVVAAIGDARRCVELCVHNNEYREGMRFAVSYTHTCAAFAGAFLLRFARLFPNDMDVLQTIGLVAELAKLLSEVPAGRFGHSLNSMLAATRARLRSGPLPLHPTTSNPNPSSSTESFPAEAISSTTSSSADARLKVTHIEPMQSNSMGMDITSQTALPDLPLGFPTNDSADGSNTNVFFDLLGDGDWAPWIQNSMFGDLQALDDTQMMAFGLPQGDPTWDTQA